MKLFNLSFLTNKLIASVDGRVAALTERATLAEARVGAMQGDQQCISYLAKQYSAGPDRATRKMLGGLVDGLSNDHPTVLWQSNARNNEEALTAIASITDGRQDQASQVLNERSRRALALWASVKAPPNSVVVRTFDSKAAFPLNDEAMAFKKMAKTLLGSL